MYKKILFISILGLAVASCNSSFDNKKNKELAKSDTLIENRKKEQKVELASLDKPYNPNADAKKDIVQLIDSAGKQHKNIILQAGGNWCIWCLRFEKFRKENTIISNLVDSNFLYYHLNYSEENKNEEVLSYYGNPGKLGYPVFIILNAQGELIHIQGSEQLEDGVKSYDAEKVIQFLEKWKVQR